MICCKIGSIDGEMLGFTQTTAQGIKFWINEDNLSELFDYHILFDFDAGKYGKYEGSEQIV